MSLAIKKQLLRAGFEDEMEYLGENPFDHNGEIEFQVIHNFKGTDDGIGHLQIKGYKDSDEVQVTVFDGSGYELLMGTFDGGTYGE
jgi:hypothetical protein